MRTTLAIDDVLLAVAKRRAAEEGLTLGRFVERAVRHELAREQPSGPRPVVPVHHGVGGVRPGVDVASNRGLIEALDDGVDLDGLR